MNTENVDLRGRLMNEPTAGILGRGKAIEEVRAAILRAAPHGFLVTLFGPTGGGKDLAAQALHGASKRRGNFVPVNCAELSAELAESVLRGHVKGAFTGAVTPHKGCLEQAADGTLFLDEVGDLPLTVQPKVLRLIEAPHFTALGGECLIPQRARFVCATHRDLPRMVREGTFREDLMQRLLQEVIRVPALRERMEDLAVLCQAFLAEAASEGIGSTRLAPQALALMRCHEWPGNVRELRNVIRSLALRCAGRAIERLDVAERLGISIERRDWIIRMLTACGGNVARTARLIGVARETLHRQMRKVGIPRGTGRPQ